MGRTTALLQHFRNQNTVEALLQLWTSYYNIHNINNATFKSLSDGHKSDFFATSELATTALQNTTRNFGYCLTDLTWSDLRTILAIGVCVATSNLHNNPAFVKLMPPSEARFQQHLADIVNKQKELKKQLIRKATTRKDAVGRLFKRRFIELWFGASTTHVGCLKPLFLFTMVATCYGYQRLLPNIHNQTCSLPVTESELEML
jgi:hypothetical protein